MRRRKKRLPLSIQALLIWFVTSTLVAMGVLQLRAIEKLSDRVFQPLERVLCTGGERLETKYKWVDAAPRRGFDDSRRIAQGPFAALDRAECVGPSGKRQPAPGFLGVVWLVVAVSVGCLVLLLWRARRVPSRKSAQRMKPSPGTSA
jgi:hypothetical protein